MIRDEIFAAIVAWTKSSPASYPATDAERRTWIDAQEGISATLEAGNDAEWLRIIADAVLGALLRRLPAGWYVARMVVDDASYQDWTVANEHDKAMGDARTPEEALTMALALKGEQTDDAR